ncbi:glycosyltransferase [Providencia rettgeri]|nr:glycosyltransferase [Providencia rettgeri]MDK3009193.1 glycosyltransferase [Providencia rettgeri]
MNILQLSKYYKPYCGGVESVVADLSEGLILRGHTINVLAIGNSSSNKPEIIKGVHVTRAKECFNIAQTSISFEYIKLTTKYFNDCDIVHLHLPNPLANIAYLVAFILNKRKPKLIIHWHSDIIKQKKLLILYKPLLNWLLNKADIIIVTSKVYLDCSKQLSMFKHKCKVVPIGIDSLIDLSSQERTELIKNKYNNSKIIFSLGRHIYYKGFEYLILAAKNVDNAIFLIGGSGPDTEKYRELIRKNNLEKKVFLIGRIEQKDLANYYRASTLFCFPSIEKSEAFGVVQLEAMSIGTPVISTNIQGSGVPWVNKNNVSGFICEPKDIESLSEHLNIIINNDHIRKKLSIGAKDRYVKHFTKNKMINDTESIYLEIFNR